MNLPLYGITVVSFEQAVAAPLATRNLADLGARVIKVERPTGGDMARDYDHVVAGTGAHFTWLNRGKESLAVDLKNPEASAAVRRLVSSADVFVQNLAPRAADRLGFGAEALRGEKPELVVAGLSGFGRGGPWENRKAYDMLVQAESGLIAITGTPETPVKTGIPTADIASGMYLSQSVLAALLRRFRTGDGATIEISMLEATIEWLGHAVNTYVHTGAQPPRMGLRHASIAPYGAYPTTNGDILIGVQNDSGWRTLVTDALAAPELAEDPRFTTNVDRVAHRVECDAEVAKRTREWTFAALEARLHAAGIPAARVADLGGAVDHPQLRARGRWRTVETENAAVPALLPPATFEDTEAPMGAVPALGQHTAALLAEAGLSAVGVQGLLDAGAAVQSAGRGTINLSAP